MPTVNMHEAKTQLSKLVEAAVNGEEVVIAKAGKPLVRLTPVVATDPPRRRLGGLAGQGWAAPDAWDPMTEEELADWYDGPIFPDDAAEDRDS